MKKLVSRNPIQRFKQGKVIKAQSGFKTAKRHDYARGAVKYEKDKKTGRWLANYVSGPDTKQYYVAEGSTGYDRDGNHNIFQNGEWVRIKGQSNQGIIGKNGITKTESFDQRAAANGFKTRDEVKQLQEKLASIGLYDGNIDGLWGVKTQGAFDQFNNANYKAPKANTKSQIEKKTEKPKAKAISMENGKIKVNPKELKQRTADFITSPAVTVPTALWGPAYLSALAKGQLLHDVSHNVSNFVHSNIVKPVWNMVDPRNVAKRIINIKSSLPEAISEEGEGYSIDPSKINYSYKKGGEITKAQKGWEVPLLDKKTTNMLNEYFNTHSNDELIKPEYRRPAEWDIPLADERTTNLLNRYFETHSNDELIKPRDIREIANVNPTYEVSTQIINRNPTKYNRSQIRDIIRMAGINPYQFTGAQRKNLRKYLNGEEYDESLLNSMFEGYSPIKAQNGWKLNGPYANQTEVNALNNKFAKPGSYHFDVVPESQRMDNAYIAPGSYNLQGVTFNRRNIRDNRNMYKTVDDYWNYLNSPEGMKSNDFQLWSNIMRTQDGALNREVFDDVMSKYGISGNLGRRDSGRLANVLNTLNEIGTNGSEARKAFINSYNKAFDEGSTPIVKNSGHDLDAKVSLTETTQPSSTTRRFIIPDYAGQFRNWVQSQPLFSEYAKQGGKLISRNPVKQFKQK